MSTMTSIRPIAAHQVKTTGSALFGHYWNIYVGPARNRDVLRVHAVKDEATNEWIVTTKDDLNAQPVEVARVKTLKSFREVCAWLYNDKAGVPDQPALDEVLETASKTARRKAPAALSPEEAGVKVGDIFYTSWGYDQTQSEFYQVVGLTPKGVKIRQIARSWTEAGQGSYGEVVAAEGHFVSDEVETKVLRGSATRPSLSFTSYKSAWKWDGRPVYNTAPGYGH